MIKSYFILLIVILGIAKLSTATAQDLIIEPSTQIAGANFGYSLAQDGDWLLVGAKNDTIEQVGTGTAYFYKKENNKWTEWQKVGPVSGNESDLFGISVALSGRYAAVGANGDDTNSLNSGAVYMYTLTGDRWEKTQVLLPNSDGFGSDEFGVAVDLKGSLLVVGAYSDFSNGPFSGAAYIYRLVGDEWQLESKVFASDAEADDKFGRSVATDGRKVISCGVLNDDLGSDSGSAYVFAKQNGIWQEEAKILANDGAENDRFGRSVDIDFNVVAIGSVLDDDNGEQSGSVYIYNFTNQGWTFKEKIVANDGQANDFFGYSLSLYNPYLVVGAHNEDELGMNSGSVYVFQRQGAEWEQVEKILSQNGGEGYNFGEAVDLNEYYISIGSPFAYRNNIQTGNVEILCSPVITGISESTGVSINVYPNPATDQVYLEGIDLTEFVSLKIIDASGRAQTVPISNSDKVIIDAGLLNNGIYFIDIFLKQGVFSTTLIISR